MGRWEQERQERAIYIVFLTRDQLLRFGEMWMRMELKNRPKPGLGPARVTEFNRWPDGGPQEAEE